MVFLLNPPEADKSLSLPCEMRSLFLWGYAKKNPRNINLSACGYFFRMPSVFARRLRRTSDFEQKSSFTDGH
jgi:hypothetical protein